MAHALFVTKEREFSIKTLNKRTYLQPCCSKNIVNCKTFPFVEKTFRSINKIFTDSVQFSSYCLISPAAVGGRPPWVPSPGGLGAEYQRTLMYAVWRTPVCVCRTDVGKHLRSHVNIDALVIVLFFDRSRLRLLWRVRDGDFHAVLGCKGGVLLQFTSGWYCSFLLYSMIY